MAGKIIRVTSSDGGEFDAYLARPSAGPVPGIVLIQEIFGLTPWVKKISDQFAEHGYLVLAPDMFWRLEPNFVADWATEEERQKGLKFRGEIDHAKGIEDISAAAESLKAMAECNGKIGVTGFCMGGTFAYLAAARLDIDAAVSYYGTQVHEFLGEGSKVTCPMMFHMGDHDDAVSIEDRNRIHAALIGIPNIAIYRYDAGHAFANSDRPDLHLPDVALKAHARTFEVFDQLR